ncbi:hypothetical protein ACLFMI_03845 [Pseudonocardia nantongensis]|uniref:hypothetical protein n=1 Tax=Pseudonocardia nantongensis TaxID=1181885 RepID=UPI003979C506
MLEVPGARYACVADPVTGAVVATRGFPATHADEPAGSGTPNGPRVPDGAGAPGGSGTPVGSDAPDGTAVALLDWARTEDARAGFEDAMITTERAYHLVRAAHGASGRVLVYLLLDRSRGNLALARRALARWPGSTATAPEPALSSGDGTPGDRPGTAPPRPLTAMPTRGDARPVTALPGSAALRPVPPERAPELPPVPTTATAPVDPTARTRTPPAVPARVTVPRQAPPPAAEQDPPVQVPLPRRGGGTPPSGTAPASTAPAARGPAEPPDGAGRVTPAAPPGGRWADDVSTMARILEGLRRLDGSRGPES